MKIQRDGAEGNFVFGNDAAALGFPFTNTAFLREFHRDHNVALDFFDMTRSEVKERVQNLTRERELPYLNQRQWGKSTELSP